MQLLFKEWFLAESVATSDVILDILGVPLQEIEVGSFCICIKDSALADVRKAPIATKENVIDRLKMLSINPHTPSRGRREKVGKTGAKVRLPKWSIRLPGKENHRLIYDIDDDIVRIYTILGHYDIEPARMKQEENLMDMAGCQCKKSVVPPTRASTGLDMKQVAQEIGQLDPTVFHDPDWYQKFIAQKLSQQ